MAFGGAGGSNTAKSDINVTPLVDVVLVLLIIFLVAMPIVMRNITVEVPKKTDEPIENIILPDQVTLEITKGGVILLNGVETARQDLPTKLHDRLQHKREKAVFVDFDDSVRYGDAVHMMDLARGAGATTVALKMKDAYGTATPVPTPTP